MPHFNLLIFSQSLAQIKNLDKHRNSWALTLILFRFTRAQATTTKCAPKEPTTMPTFRFNPALWFALALSLFTLGSWQTASADNKAIDALGGNSLAKHHIVLQETESDLQRQTLLLNVTGNLLKAYGDNVDIEVVAFGPGITLLFANNEHAKRIESLSQQGVRFSACMNALKNATERLGHEPALNPVAKKVPAGIVRVIELVDAGYILVRP